MKYYNKCRHCKNKLDITFLDLGFAPPSNAYLKNEDLKKPEIHYPLKVMVCTHCWLVQTIDYTSESLLFNEEYAYFSSTSSSYLSHAKKFVEKIIPEFQITKSSFVVEIASNDGYLLKNFVKKNINCLGIEPTKSTANAARKKGIQVIEDFFGVYLANKIISKHGLADFIIGNNVYAHVPDINDFTIGLEKLLSNEGVITLEFNHIIPLIQKCQFDTVYHEHFEYHSLHSAQTIFKSAGLIIWDVEEIDTHGGSLRIYGSKINSKRKISNRVKELIQKEKDLGILTRDFYSGFQAKCNKIKNEFLKFLIDSKIKGYSIGAYGAAAKANTLLNFSKVDNSLLPFVCDAAKSKQGKFLPGSHIPIIHPNELKNIFLDYLIIFPWNIVDEIMTTVRPLLKNNTKIVTFIPNLKIL